MELDEFAQAVIWIFATIATISGGCTALYKGYRKLKEPIIAIRDKLDRTMTENRELLRDQDVRIKSLEKNHKLFKKRLEEQNELSYMKGQALVDILEHMETGNHNDEMKKTRKKLMQTMFNARKEQDADEE